ncbi:flagellar hook assembly protein FlgD [Dyella tabacisoli]|uniref:Basal-body rod modification protein FlgD n=1 Tax=Dyella tabacisoli TaxID=2282381 RepID=A0A369USE0_9GAMM|nr:flagellar hook capping FlgD N-terminal domain-containing protein [Dyella tabacisoli]RDD82638.1 flagellar hook capping protein [Dyella tabacisoli]
MSDISVNGSGSGSGIQSASAGKGQTLTQANFLSLLVQQMRNQDPTQPMDASQMVSQLAQISQVSATQGLQTSFDSLSKSLQSNQLLQASGMVGRSVTVPSSAGKLSAGGVIDGAVNVPTSGARVLLQVTDASGTVVRHIELGTPDAGLVDFHWDGLSDSGEKLPAGAYGLKAQAGTAAAQTYVSGKVSSVGMAGSDLGTYLQVDGFGGVLLGQVARVN